jgi:hypothetical protein
LKKWFHAKALSREEEGGAAIAAQRRSLSVFAPLRAKTLSAARRKDAPSRGDDSPWKRALEEVDAR